MCQIQETNIRLVLNRIIERIQKAHNPVSPIKCVQMLPVSEWRPKMDLKHSLKELSSGLCPNWRYSLSCIQSGSPPKDWCWKCRARRTIF